MASSASAFSNPYFYRAERPESVANNSARPAVTPDRDQHAKQRELLRFIEQFVKLSECVQNYVDNYWDLDQIWRKFLRDPANENVSEISSHVLLTVRWLGDISDAFIEDLGHKPEDEEKVKEYFRQLNQLNNKVSELAEMQSGADDDVELTNTMVQVCRFAELARRRAIVVHQDVNDKTQERLDLLNQFFPEDVVKLGTDSIAQPSTGLPAPGETSTQSGGSLQIATQQFTRSISNES